MKEVPIWEKSNLTLEEAAAYSGTGRSRSLFRHWYQQTARNERFQGLYLCSLEWYEAAAETPQAG